MKFSNSKQAINYLALLLVLFLSLNLNISCDTTEQQSKVKILLEAEDASCTEAWLNLKIESIALPIEITLFQGDSLLFTTNINSSDTTLFVENLLPNQNYSFYSTMSPFSHSVLKSNVASVTTMDTTSHNFTWETFEFGGANGSSYLNDVAIINENDIWAVGEIHTAETDQFDSNGVWVKPYNAVHWDGVKWELKRILVDYRGEQNFAPLTGVFALPDGQIIFSSGLPYLPKGNSWQLYHLWDMGVFDENDGSVNSIWGTSIDNLYFVGTKGTIVHYNGSSWTKIESGTEKNIYGIYGDLNSNTNKYEILAVASNRLTNTKELDILMIDKNSVEKIATQPIAQPLLSLWFKPNKKYYLVGSGIYTKNSLIENNWEILSWDISNYFKYCIVAQNMNDLIITGAFNEVLHFNGISWKSYRGKEIPFESGRLTGADYKKDIVAIVGQYDAVGLIHIGRK